MVDQAVLERNPSVEFDGQPRRNGTHVSTMEPEARLHEKAQGQLAELSYLQHVLVENRNGLALQATVTPATGTAEQEAVLAMVLHAGRAPAPKTLVPSRRHGRQRAGISESA